MAHLVPLNAESAGLDVRGDILHVAGAIISETGRFFPALKNFSDTFCHFVQAVKVNLKQRLPFAA